MTRESNWWFYAVPPSSVPVPSAGYFAFFVADGTESTTASSLYKKDSSNVVTPLIPIAYSNEDAQDAVGSILTDTATVDFTYDDAGNTISAIVPAGSIGSTQLTDNGVTFAKMQDLTTDRLLGRDTAGTGDPEQIAVGGGIEFTGAPGIQTSAFTGDVTKTAGGTALTIAADAVTYAKMQNITTDSLVGRDTASTGDPETISVGGGIEFTGSGGIQTSALTGDATKTAGGTALTLATVNSNVGAFGSATQVPTITLNGKGLATAVSNTSIQLASTAAVTGLDAALAGKASGTTTDTTIVNSGTTLAPALGRAALTGEVTASAASNVTTIAADVVTNTKLANMAGLTIKGNSSTSTGDPADLTPAAINQMLNFNMAASARSIVTNTTITNATTEQTLATFTVPADQVAVNDTAEVFAGCYVVTAAITQTAGTTFRIRVGSNVAGINNVVLNPTVATNRFISVRGQVTFRTIGGSGTVIGSVSVDTNASIVVGTPTAAVSAAVAVATNASFTVSVTMQQVAATITSGAVTVAYFLRKV